MHMVHLEPPPKFAKHRLTDPGKSIEPRKATYLAAERCVSQDERILTAVFAELAAEAVVLWRSGSGCWVCGI